MSAQSAGRNPWKRLALAVGALWAVGMVTIGPPLFLRFCGAVAGFNAYSESLTRGDLRAAYADLRPALQSEFSFADFSSQLEQLQKQFGPLRAIRRVGAGINSDGWPLAWRADVEADQEYAAATLRFVYYLRLSKGHWTVWSFRRAN